LGYINKTSNSSEILKAIRQVLEGRKYISEGFIDNIISSGQEKFARPLHEKLSRREFQILLQIDSGKNSRQIAEELVHSLSTVNTYRLCIFEKLNVKSNTELIHYFIRNKLNKSPL
jgi:DNA-binding NarL/FixJ family response regulator